MVGGTDNGRQKTRNHGYDVIVGGELFTDYLIGPQTCHAKPKTQINRRRTLPASSRWWDAHASSLARKTSPKVRTLWHCSRLKERGALPMIDRGDIRQAIDRQQYLGFTAGRWLYRLEYKADSLIAKFKEAGGTYQRD